jgi:hypothetical protein
MTHSTLDSTFKTPLGQVVCKLTADTSHIEHIGAKEYKNGKSTSYTIGGHHVELIEFKIRQPLYNGETVKDSHGWIWRIEKIADSPENISLHCFLTDHSEHVDFDVNSGEHLESIEASNPEWTLHIGTEDGEIMHTRAALNDGFPKRLKDTVSFDHSITKVFPQGFETELLALHIGEHIHIQFLAAYDRTNSESVNTWLAVDALKSDLEEWVGM